jgi:CheY-like chemotaxis protein
MADILVIDDEADVRDALQVALSLAGHKVRVAANGPEGIESCQRQPPDIVVTDLIMPQAHGFDVIGAVRAQSRSIAIVAISGGGNYWPETYEPGSVTTSAYLAAALEFGADAILTKPFSSEELLDSVAGVIARRSASAD